MEDKRDNRPFPMQQPRDSIALPKSVPWWIAEWAHKEYENYCGGKGCGETLERLAERGGFKLDRVRMVSFREPQEGFYSGQLNTYLYLVLLWGLTAPIPVR